MQNTNATTLNYETSKTQIHANYYSPSRTKSKQSFKKTLILL